MLTAMRRFSKSWITKGLMLLLVVSFAIWGIGDMFRGNPAKREVARVGREVITAQDLTIEFHKNLPDARRQFGRNLSAREARQLGVLDQTLNLMVERLAFDQEVDRLGVSVGGETVYASLAAVPQLRDKDGKFDETNFRQMLARIGMNEKTFIALEEQDRARRLIFEALSSGVVAPKTMIDNIYRARGAKRVLEIVSIRNESVGKAPNQDESALKAYYETHPQSFMVPSTRAITVVSLDQGDLARDITISKDDARAAYDANASSFVLPQRRDLVQVLLSDEAKAMALYKRAKAEKNLQTAAKEDGQTAIIMKKVDDKTVLPELYTTVFGIEEGDIALPVKSNMGWHVIQLLRIYEGGPQPFDAVRDTIEETLREEKVGDLVARNINKLDEALGAETPLEDVANDLRLRLVRFDGVTAEGLDAQGKGPEELPKNEEILRAAFSQDVGQASQVIEDGDGRYLVVRTDKITPSHRRSFDEVKDIIASTLREEGLAREAAKEAEKIAEEMRAGRKATSYASMPGTSVRLSSPISLLGDMDKDLIPTAVQHVFDMKKGDVITLAGPGRQYVIRLADIVPVDPLKPEPSRLKVVDDFKQIFSLEIIAQYSQHIKNIFPVKIDSALLASLRERDDDAGM